MKKLFLLLSLSLIAFNSIAEEVESKNGFKLKIYGQVRADLFYNTRANVESVDGLFYSYPMDIKPDAEGNDLNDQDNSNFYLLYSRLGLDVNGPKLGSAKTSAKIEFDFRGSGTTLSLIRHATPISISTGANHRFLLVKHGTHSLARYHLKCSTSTLVHHSNHLAVPHKCVIVSITKGFNSQHRQCGNRNSSLMVLKENQTNISKIVAYPKFILVPTIKQAISSWVLEPT